MSQWPSPDSHAQAYANPRSNESGDTGFSSNPGSNDPSTQECFSPMSNASGDTGVGSNPGDLSSVGDNLMWNQVPVLCNAVSNSLQFVGNPGSNNSVSFANSAVSSAVVYINTGHSDPASYGNFGANTPVGHTVTGQSNPASMSNWSPDTAVANTNNTETSNPASYPNFNLETLDVLLATIGVEEFASAPELTDNMMHPEMPRNVTPNFLGSQVESYSLMTDVMQSASPMQVQPYLEILRQPQRNGHRFRYTSERGSHGTLEAERMSKDQKKKEYVSVKLVGYGPRAKIVVSLVTNDSQRESHIHRLVSKKSDLSVNEWSHPEIQVDMACEMTATFSDIAVTVVPQKMLTDMHFKEHISAVKGKSRSVPINPAVRRRLDEELKSKIQRLKKFDGQHIVVLKFEAYSVNDDGSTGAQLCSPVFSKEVINQRSTQNGELRISKISKSSESCKGGHSRVNDTQMLMFTSKVKKGVMVRFCDVDGWVTDVEPEIHEQTAVAVVIPPYKDQDLKAPVKVSVQLVRKPTKGSPSEDVSEPMEMKYVPHHDEADRPGTKRSRSSEQVQMVMPDSGFVSRFDNLQTGDAMMQEAVPSSEDDNDDDEDCEEVCADSAPRQPGQFRTPATMVDTTQGVKFEADIKLTRSQAGGDARDEVEEDEYGDTELHSAVLSMNLDEVKSVVNKLHQDKDFAAVDARNCSAQTPLYLATLTNKVEVMKYLLEYGAQLQLETDAGNNCIHAAVREGHEEALRILLKRRGCRNVLNAVDNDGKTAMHMAQFGNRWRCMELLLRAGADINAGDKTAGLSPLHHAVKDAHAQSYIYLLMQSTVDPDKRACNGSTPLHIAAAGGNYVAAWLLINAGADPYMQDCVSVEMSDDEEESLEGHIAYDYAADNPEMALILDGITFEELWNFLHSAPAENEADIKACQFLATLLGGGEGDKTARERNAVDQEAATMLKTLQSQAEGQLKVITDYEAREGTACHFRNVLKAIEADSQVDVVMKDPNSI